MLKIARNSTTKFAGLGHALVLVEAAVKIFSAIKKVDMFRKLLNK